VVGPRTYTADQPLEVVHREAEEGDVVGQQEEDQE
jgi:hypothetical protein